MADGHGAIVNFAVLAVDSNHSVGLRLELNFVLHPRLLVVNRALSELTESRAPVSAEVAGVSLRFSFIVRCKKKLKAIF